MATNLIFDAQSLVLGYDRTVILRDVTLRIRRGEYWFFLGPNGTGKTTLLRTLLGILPPCGGTLRHHAAGVPAEVGFVPQHTALAATLPTTIREVVSLGLVGLHLARAKREERIVEALDQVGLGTLGGHDYWALSGGQQQRTLVARALARRPSVLVLDEPMSGLDLVAEDRLLPLLAAWNRERGLTILYVTHTVALARRYASHVCLVAGGSATAGARDEVLAPAHLEATYGVAVPDETESNA